MKNYFIILFLAFNVLLFPRLKAQELYSTRDKAEDAYNHLEYAEAAENYLKLYQDESRDQYLDRLAICYFKIKDYTKAIYWLKKSLEINSDNDYFRFIYAECIQHTGNYSFALSQYRFVGSKDKDLKKLTNLRIQSCEAAEYWIKNPGVYHLKPDSNLNSENSDFSVSLTKNGLIFTSDRPVETGFLKKDKLYGWTNTHFLNLFSAKKDLNGKFQTPVLFSRELASDYHTANAVLCPDQKTLFFTRTEYLKNPSKVFRKKYDKEDFINRLQIFYSKFQDGIWSKPLPFPYNRVNEYSVGHPAISSDGKILYFASDMPGGKGGIDLYYSEIKKDGSFGKPVNLGDSINSAGNEEFPVIGMDKNLYFSSDGWPGMGGLDIFSSKGELNHWGQPLNLGVPVNSSMDDFGFIPEDSIATKGYLSSNREKGLGGDDIYDFTRPVPKPALDTNAIFKGRIVNAETNLGILGVKIDISEGKDSSFSHYLTDSLGNYKFSKKRGQKYILRIKKENFFTLFDTLIFNENGVLTSKLKPSHLVPMVVNKSIRLENIHYDFNSWKILPQAARILDGLVKILKENPEISINLDSHTDTRGDTKINKYVSVHRAKSAVDYLISQGIDPHRLKARGFGKERPLVRCDNGYRCSDLDHQLNRRTEFSITRILHDN